MMHIPAPQSPRNPNPGLVNIVVRFENAIVTMQGWLRQHLDLPRKELFVIGSQPISPPEGKGKKKRKRPPDKRLHNAQGLV